MFHQLFLIWLLANVTRSQRRPTTSTPNILIFIIDDMPFLQKYNESAPDGVHLMNYTVEYENYPTPNINAFRNEAVIFPRSYCGGPKCSPSRYSVLTGRMPSRSEWATLQTLATGVPSEGTEVEVAVTKLSGDDVTYNLPTVLQDNGYYTGMVGKWHLMPEEDTIYNVPQSRGLDINSGYYIGCEELESAANASLYERCTDVVKQHGFDFVDGFYYGNIENDDDFSHNPEWMVSRAQAFIDEAIDVEEKPFFLYFASTLIHGPEASTFATLTTRHYNETPKGILSGDEVPDDISMDSRDKIWNEALQLASELSSTEIGVFLPFATKMEYARHLWMDAQFGAIIAYLRSKRIYRDTMVILQNDHGQVAKGMTV